MQDEGVGIRVVNRLEVEGLPGADLMDGGTGGFHLLGILQSYSKVIIVDASLDDYPAGHVRVLHPRYAVDFPKQLSAHEIGLKDLIDAAAILGNLPDIQLVAISVKEFQDMGTELTAEVMNAIPLAMRHVRDMVQQISPG